MRKMGTCLELKGLPNIGAHFKYSLCKASPSIDLLLLVMETGAPHSPIVPPQMILRCRAVW